MKENKKYKLMGVLLFSCLMCIYGAAPKMAANNQAFAQGSQRPTGSHFLYTDESESASPSQGQQCVQPIDHYGDLRSNDTRARLDNFAIQVHQQPGAKGYIVIYGPRRGRQGAAQRSLNFQIDYLAQRGIPAHRLITRLGGYREEMVTELWMIPGNCTPPSPTPTVLPSQVVILQHPEVGPGRLLIIQTFVREFGPLTTNILRQNGQPRLSEWDINITSSKERGEWAWVEVDRSGEDFELFMWALLHKVGGRWRAAEKRVATTNIQRAYREFVKTTIQRNPAAPREIFNTGN